MASSWGRKETLITPPTVPVYTFTAFAVALMCLCFFAWQMVAFSLPIMQRSYFTEYVRAAVGSAFHQTGEYRLFYLAGAKRRQPRLALPVDFEDGQTTLPSGRTVPVQLTFATAGTGVSVIPRGASPRSSRTPRYTVGSASRFSKVESVTRLFLSLLYRDRCSARHHALVCRAGRYQAAQSSEVWPRPPWSRDDESKRVPPCRHTRVLASSSRRVPSMESQSEGRQSRPSGARFQDHGDDRVDADSSRQRVPALPDDGRHRCR